MDVQGSYHGYVTRFPRSLLCSVTRNNRPFCNNKMRFTVHLRVERCSKRIYDLTGETDCLFTSVSCVVNLIFLYDEDGT